MRTRAMVSVIGITMTVVIIAGGCATPPYAKREEEGEQGYVDTQIADTTYVIEYQEGIWFDIHGRAEDFALYRCAELTLEKGYDYFVVMGRENLPNAHRIKIKMFNEGDSLSKAEQVFADINKYNPEMTMRLIEKRWDINKQ